MDGHMATIVVVSATECCNTILATKKYAVHVLQYLYRAINISGSIGSCGVEQY